MKAFLVLAVFVAFATPVWSQEQDGRFDGPYLGEVIRVIDGDTFVARVDIWPTISATVSVRLRGYDAPELFQPACGPEEYQANLALGAMREVLPEGQDIVLFNVEEDSFSGRVVSDVSRVANVNAYSLSVLLENREAVRPWDPSEPNVDWCAEE